MRAVALTTSALITGLVLAAQLVVAADDVRRPVQGGTIVIPPSSVPKPAESGRAHTNVEIFHPDQPLVPAGRPAQPAPSPGNGPGR
jgi:hypothetical protein